MSVGRHPLAGLALGFAAVAGAFTVNMLIKPLDAVLVEFTNDAAHLVDPNRSIGLGVERLVLHRVGAVPDGPDRLHHRPHDRAAARAPTSRKCAAKERRAEQAPRCRRAESRGLRFALYGLIGLVVVFALLTLPAGAPLRNPDTGELIGNSPFMNGLIALIMLMFLVTGWAYGIGAGTLRTLTEVIAAIEKSITNLGGTIFLFFVLSQFVAYFTYTNMGTVMALSLSGVLQAANIGALPLLIGFIVVVAIIDLLLTGAIAKWAIFAPVFVPLLMKLGVEPEAVLAAYRVGDSPMNAITPLNAYFALVVGFAQKYDKTAGVGTIVSLMLPYVDVDVRAVDRAVRRLAGARPALGPVNALDAVLTSERDDRMDTMSSPAFPSTWRRREEHLMRFLSVEGVTGHEANIAAAVSDALKAVGVPASAIRFDDANTRIPLPTETGNLIVDLPGTRPGPRLLFSTHLDTVPLCAGAKPRREGERIVSRWHDRARRR